MLKKFLKKHKENFLLCIGALAAGVLSFFVTLKVYHPEVNVGQFENEFNVTQTSVNSVANEEIKEKNDKTEQGEVTVKVEVSNEILNESSEKTDQEILNTILEETQTESVEIKQKTEIKEDKITEAFAFKKNQNFDWPLSGDIIKDFAVDSLVYSNTLNEWRTHEGIDIAGKEGDVIVSVEDGIVERIFEDEKYGETIVVSHENGYKTFYSFVSPQNLSTENQKVRKGEAIGRLTSSTKFEAKEVTHLHFEMLKNGVKISPILEIIDN